MRMTKRSTRVVWVAALMAAVVVGTPAVHAQTTPGEPPYTPRVGQSGKDVVWVPTPQALVERMLDVAQVTPADYLIDLGSGDGRTVIAAARRGVRAHGIEFNPDMVALALDAARREGVSDLATFERADLFRTDFSKATVITMFLLTQINLKLRPTLLDLEPGTRIVSNTFRMSDWEPDLTSQVEGTCESWCEAHLWIVPAKVEGTWQIGGQELVLAQQFQRVSGTLGGTPITDGRLNGREISFAVDDERYTGQVSGGVMSGTVTGTPGGSWTATRGQQDARPGQAPVPATRPAS